MHNSLFLTSRMPFEKSNYSRKFNKKLHGFYMHIGASTSLDSSIIMACFLKQNPSPKFCFIFYFYDFILIRRHNSNTQQIYKCIVVSGFNLRIAYTNHKQKKTQETIRKQKFLKLKKKKKMFSNNLVLSGCKKTHISF